MSNPIQCLEKMSHDFKSKPLLLVSGQIATIAAAKLTASLDWSAPMAVIHPLDHHQSFKLTGNVAKDW